MKGEENEEGDVKSPIKTIAHKAKDCQEEEEEVRQLDVGCGKCSKRGEASFIHGNEQFVMLTKTRFLSGVRGT